MIQKIDYSVIEPALHSANQSKQAWASLSQSARIEILNPVITALDAAFSDLSSEVHTHLWTELGMPQWVRAIELQKTLALCKQSLSHTPSIQDESREPCGIVVVISPWSDPFSFSISKILSALVAGNSVIWKPSERAGATSQWVAKLLSGLFEAASLPPGIFQMILGDKEMGRRISLHSSIASVLFTGSYETGARIKQDTLQQPYKLVHLEMSTKNVGILLPTFKMGELHRVLDSAYYYSGQSYLASPLILVHQDQFDSVIEQTHSDSKRFSSAPEPHTYLGPLADDYTLDRFIKYQGIATREGFEVVMRGKSLGPGQSLYVSPAIQSRRHLSVSDAERSVFFQNEVCGPTLTLIGYQSLDEAAGIANSLSYGHSAFLMGDIDSESNKLTRKLDFGWVGQNVTPLERNPVLPIVGRKKSGFFQPSVDLTWAVTRQKLL